ncbi:hypothetical protein [Streptomyces sp. IB201691-2A2]|uniref:hypothetical protein n=1 Tax=Streptomyces sp. IB201691-2A2 TaxID=2561920 RepID=UPI00163D90F6|nr:hypothetical protein [Streptomyces sp. IB201691-2A2]
MSDAMATNMPQATEWDERKLIQNCSSIRARFDSPRPCNGTRKELSCRRVIKDHFSTDVSYLSELRSYLDDLLRTREKLRAMTDADAWARAEWPVTGTRGRSSR